MLRVIVADAFASDGPFTGNPAGVVPLHGYAQLSTAAQLEARPLQTHQLAGFDEGVLAAVAAELNHSETAFVQPIATDDVGVSASAPGTSAGAGGDGDDDSTDLTRFSSHRRFALRWLTPEAEVDLCGHATLATAAVLFQVFGNESESLSFVTRSGELVCSRMATLVSRDGAADTASGSSAGTSSGGVAVQMEFPLNKAVEQPLPLPDGGPVAAVVSHVVGDLPLHSVHYDSVTMKLIVRLADSVPLAALASARPDYAAMLAVDQSSLGDEWVKGVCVTMRGPGGAAGDFLSRYFNPWVGINEDPVNGSSHTLLAPYWAAQLGRAPGDVMVSKFASRRSGVLYVGVTEGGKTAIGGTAAIVLDGRMVLPARSSAE